MHKTQEEKQEYISKIFNDKVLFEWEVLHVSSHYDRLEIMEILAETLVRDKLKFELNFLYIQSYKDFKFSQIVNIIFHEIANEWLGFATEVLYYPKKEAIEELQGKSRVIFVHSLAKSYYKKYKHIIFEEVADTFIELVSNIEHLKDEKKLIQEVLQSDLIKNKQILAMHSFSQLWSRVKAAQNIKNSDVATAKMKIAELEEIYLTPDIKVDEKQKVYGLLEKANLELNKVQLLGLDAFDPAVKRLKDTMVQSMIGMDHLS